MGALMLKNSYYRADFIIRNRSVLTLVAALVFISTLAGCAAPSYIDKGTTDGKSGENDVSLQPVFFQVHQSYRDNPPECIAVLPFSAGSDESIPVSDGNNSVSYAVSDEEAMKVRKAFYGHISPLNKRDIDLRQVDFALKTLPEKDRKNNSIIGKKLNCDALMVGEVTKYGEGFFGLYSQVSVGANVKIIRAKDGEVLWEGKHVATSRGGSLPLSPLGIISGLISAVANLQEEQIFRVTDDLARRLVSTIPDENQVQYVMARVLNFRSGPGLNFSIKDKLHRSDRVEVVGRSMDGAWISVRADDGKLGYVSSSHVSPVKKMAARKDKSL